MSILIRPTMRTVFISLMLISIAFNAIFLPAKSLDTKGDSIQTVISLMSEDTAKVIFLNDLAWNLRGSYPDSAVQYLEQAIKLSLSLGYKRGEATSYNIQGVISKDIGELDLALYHLEQGLKMREKIGDIQDVAKSLNNIGTVYRHKGEYSLALKYFLESQTIRERIGDSSQIALGYQNIGVFYQSQGQYEDAVGYFEKSISINEKLNKTEELSRAYNNLGGIYLMKKNYGKALELYQRSLDLKIKLGDKKGIGNTWNNIGIILEIEGDTEEALIAYQKSIDIRRDIGDQEGEAIAYNNLGVLYKKLEAYDQALYYLNSSYSMAKSLGVLSLEHQSAQNLSEIYATLGRYEQAFRYQQRFGVLKDSLFNEEKAKEIGRLEAAFEAQKEIDAKAAELRQRTLQRNATFGGLGLVSLLAFVIIRGYHQRQRAARLLAEQKEKINAQLIVDLLQEQELESLSALMEGQEQERKRIAGDLHDRMGSKLATVRLHFSGMGEVLPQTNELPQYATAMRLLDEACGEVRQIAHNMASGVLTHFGLVAALRDMAETLQNSGRLKAQVYEFEMEGRRLDSRAEIALYRVVQELVSNVLKHARATEVSIHLTHHGDRLNLMVEDNGMGFHYDPESAASDGMGLGNIRQRIAKLGGQLSIDTAPRQGTTVIIDIPVTVSERAAA